MAHVHHSSFYPCWLNYTLRINAFCGHVPCCSNPSLQSSPNVSSQVCRSNHRIAVPCYAGTFQARRFEHTWSISPWDLPLAWFTCLGTSEALMRSQSLNGVPGQSLDNKVQVFHLDMTSQLPKLAKQYLLVRQVWCILSQFIDWLFKILAASWVCASFLPECIAFAFATRKAQEVHVPVRVPESKGTQQTM